MQYTNSTTTRPPSSYPVLDATREVRFAVVMYGGVSLAIYINGVAQELYRIVRATAAVEQDNAGHRWPVPGNRLAGTERVYRKLSHLLSHDNLLQQYREHVEKMDDYRRQLETDERDASWRKQLLEARMKAIPDPLEKTIRTDDQPIRTRFIVDILSGTSAGGINAIYLAKALANDQQVIPLKDLWVNEGDLALLLNDKSSVQGLGLHQQAKPQSLLNSQRMYLKLLKSLDDVEKAHPSQPDFKSPYADELDLFITTTDIKGVPVPLRLSNVVVYERRHRNVFHFKYAQAEAIDGERDFNDFLDTLNPFLAFAARCTTSFPFAFEPMRLCDIDEVLDLFAQYRDNDLCKSASKSWQRFFQEELDPETGLPFQPPRFAQRPFGDGGYLDNKPFSYATETLLHRQPDVLVDRKLLYIEPSPEHLENQSTPLQKPDALQNVKAALLELPTYETIRDDLQRVIERDKLIERVNKIISGIERDVNTYIPRAVQKHLAGQKVAPHRQALGTGAGQQPMGTGSMGTGSERTGTSSHEGSDRPSAPRDWASEDLAEMVNHFGRYYLPYRRLRIDSVTDELARLVARLANFDENSDQFLAIRCLVRAWREENYADYQDQEAGKPTINRFLFDYDHSYRLRRLNFTRSQVDRITRGDLDLIEELKHHRESFVKIREEMRLTSRDDQKEWREVIREFPQIRLQIYGEKLLPFAEEKSPQLETQLRFIKSKLNEVYRQLRATGRLLRSRRQPPTPESAQAGVDPHIRPESLNPLLGLIDQIGITPQDLNDILGVSLSVGSGNGSGTVAKEQRQDEEDCFRRTVAMLQRPEKSPIKDNFKAIAAELRAQLQDVFALNRHKCSQGLFALDDPLSPRHQELYPQQALYEPISPRGKELLARDEHLLASEMAQAVRGFLGYYYHNFDDYDQIRFPIFYETDVGEADVVEVIRISPEDATSLINEREELKKGREAGKKARRKLAGVSLHHFGAFLDQTWRQNDIMWGRLDGAERLISALLPGEQNALVRQELINEAHTAILKEELKPQSLLALKSTMSEALLRASTGLSVNEAIGKALEPLKSSVVKTRLEEIMRLSLADDELLDFMKKGYEVNRQLDPKPMLNSMSRAIQIIGKMFENIADANALDGKQLAWIARLGQVFWGLVTVAVPHSIANLLIFHWLKLLYLFGALVILGSILLGQPEVQRFGWTALVVTAAINVCVLLLRDYMRDRHRWLHAFKVVVLLTVIFLAAIGADELFNLALRARLLAMLQGVRSWM